MGNKYTAEFNTPEDAYTFAGRIDEGRDGYKLVVVYQSKVSVQRTGPVYEFEKEFLSELVGYYGGPTLNGNPTPRSY
jgi:hypothetical protein